jgi:hypothetical protein
MERTATWIAIMMRGNHVGDGERERERERESRGFIRNYGP